MTHLSFFSLVAVLLVVLFAVLPGQALAQPSDAQVREDVMNPGVKKLELTKKAGTKQWNGDVGAWEFVRGVRVVREYPEIEGVDLVVVGDAVYQLYGTSYRYWKFRVISNEYLGIPNPTEDEIMAILAGDMERFVTNYWYNRIVGEVKQIRRADDTFFWHTPESVSFKMTAIFDAKTSDLDVASVEQDYEVRLYRDHYQGPWQRFLSSNGEQRILSTQRYDADAVRAMPTLGSLGQERKAQAALASLPAVEVPVFESGNDLVAHTHKMLRESTPEALEAYLMQVLAPHFFVEGSTMQLTQRGADVINQTIDRAFKKEGTYADQYCANLKIDQRRSSPNRIYLASVIDNLATQIAFNQYGGTYVNGVKSGQVWKIDDLGVYTSQDPDALAYVASFTNRATLCPNS